MTKDESTTQKQKHMKFMKTSHTWYALLGLLFMYYSIQNYKHYFNLPD